MISIKNQHFNVHRILLLAIGLWPCQRSKLIKFQLILFFGILISFIVLQLLIFITAEFTLDLVINVFSIGLVFVIHAIMYNAFWHNFTEIIEQPLEELQHICNELKDKEEIAIMKKYGENMKRITFFITVWYICNLIIIILIISLPIMPNIFGVALHISESQSRDILYKHMPKYFVDRKNYLYVILLYTDVAVCIGATTMTATGLMMFAYFKHACGMLRIARLVDLDGKRNFAVKIIPAYSKLNYRIEKAMNIWNNVCPKIETMMYKGIIYAIDIHRTAIKFSTFLFSSLHFSFFSLIIVAVVCLSLNLYAMSKMVLHRDEIDQFFIHLTMVVTIFIYLFFLNYVGQEFADHNDDVFSTVYNIQWYVTPLRIQKLIVFLLQRGNKTVNLNFGGVFILSLQFFATLMKVSLSYFTVMCSVQE